MSLLRYTKEFGLRLTLINSWSRVMRRLHLPDSWVVYYLNRIKHKACLNYHRKHYGTLTAAPRHREPQYGHEIFVFWYQGLEAAPPIVKACIQSIQRHAGTHKVNVLDKDSYRQFVTLPEHIEEKFNKGLIGNAHFSDVIRFNILNRHGGLWIDATCYVTQPLPESIFTSEFFSLKDAYTSLPQRWTSFFIGGAAHNIIAENMCAFYDRYWREHDEAFTYLFLDYQIMAYQADCPEIDALIESTPDGTAPFVMMPHLADPYDEKAFDEMCQSFYVQKLSYRDLPPLHTPDGRGTVLNHILESCGTDA